MITKKHIPKIRFKGFDEDWEIKPLEEIFLRIRNAFVGTATPYYVSRGHFYLESNNIKNGLINRKTEIFINDDFHYKQKDKWLKTGDIVMVQSGHVGHSAVIPQELNNSAAHALIMFTNYKQETNPYFLNYQFLTDKVKLKIDKVTTGNTIKHILSSDMKLFECSFADIGEQNKVGAFFQSIDQTISLQRRKYEQTQTLKKSLLSKMFPKAGQTQPEIRLQGFGGDWIEMELGDIGYTYTGLSGKTKADFGHGQAMYITYMNVYSNAIASTSMLEAVDKDDSQNLVKKGDVLFTTSSETPEEVGMSSVWQHDLHLVYLNSFCFGFRLKEKVDSNYLAFMLRSNKVRADISLLAQGISRYNISKRAMMKIKVPLPSLREQAAIGQFFEQVDETIVLQAKQLKILENIKKSLLAKMFV
ncbi:restriction endonuclease subunit S [Psychrobacter aquimaris]|uniref:restriction endonuclease subunit S n=1 Tax=Psychrobacter aquimaris TaxID=292733 RepID=UPI003FCFD26D